MCIWTLGRVSAVTSSLPHQPLKPPRWSGAQIEQGADCLAEEKPKRHPSAAASCNLLRQILILRPLPTSVQTDTSQATRKCRRKTRKCENMAKGAEVRDACQQRGRAEDHWDLVDTGEPSAPSYLLQKCLPQQIRAFYCYHFKLGGWQRDHHFVRDGVFEGASG